MTMPPIHTMWAAVAAACLVPTDAVAELLQVTILARHGNRAPNGNVHLICPNFADVLQMFDVPVASLTGKGMMQLFFLGTDMRKQYIDIEAFVPEIFDNNFIYLRASDSSRTLQSGAAFGMGMYPIGSGPMHFNSSLPPPLPIHTDDEGKDSIMEVRKAQCRRRLKADEKKWKATTGKRWLQEQADLIEEVSGLCGAEIRNQRNPFQAIKDINDAFVFAYKEGFPMIKGISPETYKKFNVLAHRILYSKFFESPFKNAYMAGDFPAILVNNFVRRSKDDGKGQNNKLFNAYFGHREISYGVSEMMKVPKFQYHEGSPETELPPGSTFIWELHREWDNGVKRHIVKFGTYVPCAHQGPEPPQNEEGEETVFLEYDDLTLEPYDANKKCGFHWVTLPDCKKIECSLEDFVGIFDKFKTRYGHWREICGTRSRPGPPVVPINESSPNAFDESDGGAWGSSEDWDWEEGWDEVEEKEEEDDSALPTLVGENGDYHHDSEELGEGIFSFSTAHSPSSCMWYASILGTSLLSVLVGIRIGSARAGEENRLPAHIPSLKYSGC